WSLDKDRTRPGQQAARSGLSEPVQVTALVVGDGAAGVDVLRSSLFAVVVGGVSAGREPDDVAVFAQGGDEAGAEGVNHTAGGGSAGQPGSQELLAAGAVCSQVVDQGRPPSRGVPGAEPGVGGGRAEAVQQVVRHPGLLDLLGVEPGGAGGQVDQAGPVGLWAGFAVAGRGGVQ